MTGSRRHICSAPRTGNRFRQKCRIMSGIVGKGRLNCPRMNWPVSGSRCIRMCMNPFALLQFWNVSSVLQKCNPIHPSLTSKWVNSPAVLIHCSAPESFLPPKVVRFSQHLFDLSNRGTTWKNKAFPIKTLRCKSSTVKLIPLAVQWNWCIYQFDTGSNCVEAEA